MREVFEQSKAFFALPTEEKMSVLAGKKNRGYTPMHEEVLDSENQSKGDTKVRRYLGARSRVFVPPSKVDAWLMVTWT